MISFTGAREFQGFLLKAEGQAAGLVKDSIRKASFLAAKLLMERVAWPWGGYSPFWGKSSPKSGPYLRGRTGETRKRITPGGILFKAGDNYYSAVGSPDAHVLFHEKGGVIPANFLGYRMSPAGYLRIATRAAQFQSGGDRWADRSIRDIPGAFLFKGKRFPLWAAVRKGKNLILLYALARQSPPFGGTHRPRGIFARTRDDVEKALLGDVSARVDALVGAR